MEEIRKNIVNLIDIQTEIPRERVEKITDQILAFFPKPATMGEEEIWGILAHIAHNNVNNPPGEFLKIDLYQFNELARTLAGKIPAQPQMEVIKPAIKQPVKKIKELDLKKIFYDLVQMPLTNEERYGKSFAEIQIKLNELIAVVNELTKGKE